MVHFSHSKNLLHAIVELARDDVLFLFFMEFDKKLAEVVNEITSNGESPLEVQLFFFYKNPRLKETSDKLFHFEHVSSYHSRKRAYFCINTTEHLPRSPRKKTKSSVITSPRLHEHRKTVG